MAQNILTYKLWQVKIQKKQNKTSSGYKYLLHINMILAVLKQIYVYILYNIVIEHIIIISS